MASHLDSSSDALFEEWIAVDTSATFEEWLAAKEQAPPASPQTDMQLSALLKSSYPKWGGNGVFYDVRHGIVTASPRRTYHIDPDGWVRGDP